jgi:hypothetical protein
MKSLKFLFQKYIKMKKKLTRIIGVYVAKESPRSSPESKRKGLRWENGLGFGLRLLFELCLKCFLKKMKDNRKRKLAGRIGVV